MNWQLILGGTVSFSVMAGCIWVGYKWCQSNWNAEKAATAAEDAREAIEYVAKNQTRERANETVLADISSQPITADNAGRMLSGQIKAKNSASAAPGDGKS